MALDNKIDEKTECLRLYGIARLIYFLSFLAMGSKSTTIKKLSNIEKK
jgi:hypothetical protein